MEDKAEVILITRPRRFGKTMAMSMLEHFLKQEGKPDLFKGLKVSADKDFCALHQNKYPLIFLSFKDIKKLVFKDSFSAFKNVFSDLYSLHRNILEGDVLFPEEKKYFIQILNKEIEDSVALGSALKNLISYTYRKYNKKPILLLDEYDTPIHSAYNEGYYREMIDFKRHLLGSTLKDNDDLEKCVMTGITRVAQESLFSGLNNVKAYTVLDEKYGQYFGFTKEEVTNLLDKPFDIEPIESWYNGYQIGDYRVYNPWSVLECLSNNHKLRPYWNNTSDNALVYKLIDNAGIGLKENFENLVRRLPQIQVINPNVTFNYLEKDEGSIWSLLLHTGYLTVLEQNINEQDRLEATLAIPNREVMLIFEDIIRNWFSISGDDSYDRFIKTLENDNVAGFCGFIKTYINLSGSYFDFNSTTPEKIFHTLMLGLVVGFRAYDVSSNREAGKGRYDIILSPKKPGKRGIILEFKVCEKEDMLESTAKEALTQIVDKKYTDAFHGQEVLCIGIAFCGKELAFEFALI
jgi:hypothetical protein